MYIPKSICLFVCLSVYLHEDAGGIRRFLRLAYQSQVWNPGPPFSGGEGGNRPSARWSTASPRGTESTKTRSKTTKTKREKKKERKKERKEERKEEEKTERERKQRKNRERKREKEKGKKKKGKRGKREREREITYCHCCLSPLPSYLIPIKQLHLALFPRGEKHHAIGVAIDGRITLALRARARDPRRELLLLLDVLRAAAVV